MGVILRVVLKHEPFIIASVKYGTSDIIMKKVIEHIFDSPQLIKELEIDSTQKLSTLKRERNKSAVNFKKGGSIKIISLHGADDDVSKAIGEHVPNVVLDESPLLTPTKYLLVLKMLEGTGDYDKTFLFELWNAVNRNHFLYNIKYNPQYLKIDISLEQAMKEGRLDEKSVEEKRGLPFFEQFYECKFPDEDEIDEKGYRQLLTMDEVLNAQVDTMEWSEEEPMKLGVDVGGGGDYNVYVIRQGQNAWIESFNRSNDTMTNMNEVVRIIDKYTLTVKEDDKEIKKRLLKPEEVYIDDIGIGRGVTDRLKEMTAELNGQVVSYRVNGISVGGKPKDPTRYSNIKAENYWNAGQWVKDGGKLYQDKRWEQLSWIKYKTSSDKVLQIEPKPDLKKRTGKSPDFSEAFMLTFSVGNPTPNVR
jgi:hypothetical protein